MVDIAAATLKDQFHPLVLDDVIAGLDETNGIVDERLLQQFERLAGENVLRAQICLAELHSGKTTFIADRDMVLKENLVNPAQARHWALVASAGSTFAAYAERSDYVRANMARVLAEFKDEESQLRAVSLIIHDLTANKFAAKEAIQILAENFSNFDLEAVVAARAQAIATQPKPTVERR